MKKYCLMLIGCILFLLAGCVGQAAILPTEPAATTTLSPTATVTPTPIPPLSASSEVGEGIVFWTYGGALNDNLVDVLLLEDGGTLSAGMANNPGPSHRITTGSALLIRTDADGNVIWQHNYGGEVDALFAAVAPAGSDEYVAVGSIAASYTRDETDVYLVKVDGQGNELWLRTFGGLGMDIAKVVRQTSDGGYIIVGDRADGSPTAGVYRSKFLLIKTDAEGNEEWTRTYGTKLLYLGWAVAQTPDGGYVASGWEAKTVDDRDVFLIKVNAEGTLEWTRSWDLDADDRDGGFDMIVTSDGYIVMACIQSMDTGTISSMAMKIDMEGNEIWRVPFAEGEVGAEFWDVMEDADGRYVFSGIVFSQLNRTSGSATGDGWIIKTDPNGNVLWEHIFTMDGYDELLLSAAAQMPTGEYLFVGAASPNGARFSDALWLKITPP